MSSSGGAWPFPERFRLSWKAGAVLLRLSSVFVSTRLLSKCKERLYSQVNVAMVSREPLCRVDSEGAGEEWSDTSGCCNEQTKGDTPSNCRQSHFLHRRPSFLPYDSQCLDAIGFAVGPAQFISHLLIIHPNMLSLL